MKKFIAVGLACLFLTSSTCYAGTIYACKKKIGGTMRIVGAATVCASTEVKISWPNTAETNHIKTLLNQRTSGDTSITMGPSQWQLEGSSSVGISLSHYESYVTVNAGSAGDGHILATPTIPSMFYGRSVLLIGARLCVLDANAANYVAMTHLMVFDAGGNGNIIGAKMDLTPHIFPGCYDVIMDNAFELQAGEVVTLYVVTDNTETGVVRIGGTTLYFQMP